MAKKTMLHVDVLCRDRRRLVGAIVKIFPDDFPGQQPPQAVLSEDNRATFQHEFEGEPVPIEVEYEGQIQRDIVPAGHMTHEFHFPVHQGKHLVILVHGILTWGAWVPSARRKLIDAGFVCEPASYGRFGLLRFLLPFELTRQGAVKRVLTRINAARHTHQPARVSIIAHSFGSYVVSKIIQDSFHQKWERIIFCGSVVPAEFPFEHLTERFKAPILNEIGTKDFLPRLAERITWGYGSIGTYGFGGAPFEDRWYRGASHSDLLKPSHCESVWIPFLKTGSVPYADDPRLEDVPRLMRLLLWLPLRWIVAALIAALLGFTAWWFLSR